MLHDCPEGVFFAQPELIELAKALFFGAYLDNVNDRWSLTSKGVHALQSCSKVAGDGRRVFGRRLDCPLEDMTTFQLVLEMRAKDWVWRRWVAPKQRGKNFQPPIPDGYSVGDPKLWYTGISVCSNYLIALLRAEDFNV